MSAPGADCARLATLRDGTIKLVAEVEKTPSNLTEITRLAKLLDKFPEVPAARNASLARVRVKDTFNHDDVVDLLGSCGNSRTQRIETHLFKLAGRKTLYSESESDQIELLAYKVALIAVDRDLDDLCPIAGEGTSDGEIRHRRSRLGWRLRLPRGRNLTRSDMLRGDHLQRLPCEVPRLSHAPPAPRRSICLSFFPSSRGNSRGGRVRSTERMIAPGVFRTSEGRGRVLSVTRRVPTARPQKPPDRPPLRYQVNCLVPHIREPVEHAKYIERFQTAGRSA